MKSSPRCASVFLVVFGLACGGSKTPAEPPSGSADVGPAPTSSSPPIPTNTEPVASVAPASSAVPAASAQPSSPPVAAGPLKGTIEGKAFAAKSALAVLDPGDPSRKKVTIYDQKVDCKSRDKLTGKGRREVSVRVSWTPGASVELDAFTASVVIDEKKAPVSIANLSGRAELGTAPTKVGDRGTIKVRVSDQAGDTKVEGETQFVVCE